MAQLDARPIGGQEVVGSTHAGSATLFGYCNILKENKGSTERILTGMTLEGNQHKLI